MHKKHIEDFIVLLNEKLNEDTFLLLLKHPHKLPEINAGQFAEVLVEDSPLTFLRRPLSIHDVDYKNNTLSLLIKKLGKGTKKLSELKPDNFLNLIFPLGNSFTLLNNEKVLLTGGGCGIAPLLYLSRKLNEKGCDVHILLAAKTASDIVRLKTYENYGKLYFTTEDNSLGEKGLIIQHSLFKNLSVFKKIYTCGPERMMQAVARLAANNEIPCEVSLENTMACGIGACLCCVTETKTGNKCVCVDGPVFNTKDLKW
ncbi:MAG: dihydroorotate dehydrogenase electron transfer subunit [Bacteroidales bacterium]|nr:dihydroorotate dehydrogenase electron transfer subunit [Bacteroidales bacterium]